MQYVIELADTTTTTVWDLKRCIRRMHAGALRGIHLFLGKVLLYLLTVSHQIAGLRRVSHSQFNQQIGVAPLNATAVSYRSADVNRCGF